MKVPEFTSRTVCAIACCVLLSACSATQVKEGGKELGANALEQLVILTVFGADALQEHNEREYREWYWRTTPYRSSFTRDEYIELQDTREFERFYEELRAREAPNDEEPRDKLDTLQNRIEFEHFYEELRAREAHNDEEPRNKFNALQNRMKFESFYQELQARGGRTSLDNER